MRYVSTRGAAEEKDFKGVVETGLASDGGLYVPAHFPVFSVDEWRGFAALSYRELAHKIMTPFVGDCLSPDELRGLIAASYVSFLHPEITPLRPLQQNIQLLELFHGPTLAFKDIALQFLGRLLGHFAARRGSDKLLVLGATSGDTGSAAIEGCRDLPNVDVFILYPHQRPSDVQRLQMTTVDAVNVHVLAIKGTFDDCQTLVKQAFNDPVMRARYPLTAVNSINWARILAQTVYYCYAALRADTLDAPVHFVVPTGNFGNAFAGYVAKRMGLPIGQLVIATNRNDSLARFVATGEMRAGSVQPSLSPSMDIQMASNAERFLFELLGRDGNAVASAMQLVNGNKTYALPDAARETLQRTFRAFTVSDAETTEAMRTAWKEHHQLIDPHTAVGVHAAKELRKELPDDVSISLACAHPAKFPETMLAATGQKPVLPAALSDLYQRREHFTVLPAAYAALTDYIVQHRGAGS